LPEDEIAAALDAGVVVRGRRSRVGLVAIYR
jgi:hypothetical protein